MKALRFSQFGSFAQALRIEDLPHPEPREDEVLVKVAAASINPSDTKNVLGKMEGPILPRTPGRDFAGTVVAGAKEWIGKEVWGSGGDTGFTRDGAHAEFIVVPSQGVAPKPSTLKMAEAAAIGTNYITAFVGLIETARVASGEWVLVTGARGGVGSSVIQLAKWQGARVIAVDHGATPANFPRKYGIDVLLNSSSDDVVKRAKEAAGGKGVNVAFDCVGGPLFEICLESLGQLGRQVNITSVGQRRVSFDLLDFYHRRLALYGVDTRALDTVACARILNQLGPAFENRKLRPPLIAATVPLSAFADAFEKVDSGKAKGKIVFTFEAESA